jgi:hypothetical protein
MMAWAWHCMSSYKHYTYERNSFFNCNNGQDALLCLCLAMVHLGLFVQRRVEGRMGEASFISWSCMWVLSVNVMFMNERCKI